MTLTVDSSKGKLSINKPSSAGGGTLVSTDTLVSKNISSTFLINDSVELWSDNPYYSNFIGYTNGQGNIQGTITVVDTISRQTIYDNLSITLTTPILLKNTITTGLNNTPGYTSEFLVTSLSESTGMLKIELKRFAFNYSTYIYNNNIAAQVRNTYNFNEQPTVSVTISNIKVQVLLGQT